VELVLHLDWIHQQPGLAYRRFCVARACESSDYWASAVPAKAPNSGWKNLMQYFPAKKQAINLSLLASYY
jgi:hypothetical protein